MAHYKVILAYDGTEFQGFQRQLDVRTVQGAVESALRKIGWKDSSILAAGRTDSGVHASGQVISFDLEWEHPSQDLRSALNAHLPADISAQSVEPVGMDFHPRYTAVARRYFYRLICEEVRQPLLERYAWRIWPPVPIDPLQEAASVIIGTHDFSGFGTSPKPGGSTVREIMASSWSADGNELTYEILGNAFLYHMVRRLVSIQVEIGQGRKEIQVISAILGKERNGSVQGLAPAQGLSLGEVVFPPDIRED